MDIPPNSTAVAARSASSETRRTAKFRDRGGLAGRALAGNAFAVGAFAGRQVSTHPEDGQGLSVSTGRERIGGIDATGERRLVGSRSSAPIRSVSNRPDSTTPQPGPRPTTVYARPLVQSRNPPGSQARESDWFADFHMLRARRIHHTRHSMAAAKRDYESGISKITDSLWDKFKHFGGPAEDLPAVPFSITKDQMFYYHLQEMARKSADEGFTKRADEILKALDDVKRQTANLTDTLIADHGVPDLPITASITSIAPAGPSLTVETTPALVRTSDPFDWLATYRRLQDISMYYRMIDKYVASTESSAAALRITRMVLHKFGKFGGNANRLGVLQRAVKSELAYAALQDKARLADDALIRLGIRQCLFDIDQATSCELNELTEKYGDPDIPSAHPIQVAATAGTPPETDPPITSVTPVTEQPPVSVGPPVTAGAVPPPAQVAPGANLGLPGDAGNPTGSPAQESEWFDEVCRLRMVRSQFKKESVAGAVLAYDRVLARINAMVTNKFEEYGGKDKDLHGKGMRFTKSELMYRFLRKMAGKTAKTGNEERACEIRKALDHIKQHATESMQKLVDSHGIPDDTAAGETTAPAGTPDPSDWSASYHRLHVLKNHHKQNGDGEAASDFHLARRRLSQRVLRKFSKIRGDLRSQTRSDKVPMADLAYKALRKMALETEDDLKAREMRLFLDDIDRASDRAMNTLAKTHGMPEGSTLDAAGMERSTIDPPATNSSTGAAQPAATGVAVTPQLGAQSASRPYPTEPGQRSDTAVPEKGLHRADDSPRPPGATAPGDEHGEWAGPWWPTHAEMPQPQRTELEAGDEATGTELAEFDELLKAADAVLQPPDAVLRPRDAELQPRDAVLQPPPIPSTVGVPPEAERTPLTPTPSMPGCQLAGAQVQESDWFAVFYRLRVHRSHHARHSMVAATRDYNGAISAIKHGLTYIFKHFGGKDKDLPAACFNLTKNELYYYSLQEMARKSANEGFTERADEILKALDDIKHKTAKSMGKLIGSHGVPDLSAANSIPSIAPAGPSLTVESTPAPVRASGQFDWLADYRRLRGLGICYRGLGKPEAASDCVLAAKRVSKNMMKRLRSFGVDAECLPVSKRASKSELAYAALQDKALRTDDGLLRLGIHHSLFDIDLATLREVNELLAMHGVPDKPSAHPTQVSASTGSPPETESPASTGSPPETELPATSVTPVAELPPVTAGSPVSAGAIPWPGQVPPGAHPGLLEDADNPTGSPAQESEWFHEFYRLRVLRSEFVKRSETDAALDYTRALDRIRARVNKLFTLYDGSDKDLHGNCKLFSKPELQYRFLRKMAGATAKAGNEERAGEIREALDDVKQHATESMQGLITSHGMPDNTSAGETASPTAETAPAPTGTPGPLDWLAVYGRLDILKQHHKQNGNRNAVRDITDARRYLKQRVLRKFSKFGGDIDSLPVSDCDSFPDLAYKALHEMALQTRDELKARQIRLFLEAIDRTIIRDMNALARKLRVPEGSVFDAAGTGRSTIGPPATNSSTDAAQPAATGVTVTPQPGAQSASRPHPAEPGQRSGTAVPEMGLHGADDSPRPPGATAPGNEHGEWVDSWWPTHAEMLPEKGLHRADDSPRPPGATAPADEHGEWVDSWWPTHAEMLPEKGLHRADDSPRPPGATAPGNEHGEWVDSWWPTHAEMLPEKGLHRADDSPRPPGATAPGNEHGEWVDSWWPTHAEMPRPQRTELELGDEATGIESAEFDAPLNAACAVLQPPPNPSTVGIPPEAARAPLTPSPAMPGCQLAGSPDFARLAEGSGGVPYSRRAQIVHYFSTDEAFLKAETAFYEGHARALGWSARRCREVQGELLRLNVTAIAGIGTDEALDDIDWSALEALMRFLDTPADLP